MQFIQHQKQYHHLEVCLLLILRFVYFCHIEKNDKNNKINVIYTKNAQLFCKNRQKAFRMVIFMKTCLLCLLEAINFDLSQILNLHVCSIDGLSSVLK